jgi:hypothetical protein
MGKEQARLGGNVRGGARRDVCIKGGLIWVKRAHSQYPDPKEVVWGRAARLNFTSSFVPRKKTVKSCEVQVQGT